jgi:hypothetical protein
MKTVKLFVLISVVALGMPGCDTGNNTPAVPDPDFDLTGKYTYNGVGYDALILEFKSNGTFNDGWGDFTGTWSSKGNEVTLKRNNADSKSIICRAEKTNTVTRITAKEGNILLLPNRGETSTYIELYAYEAPPFELAGTYTYISNIKVNDPKTETITFLPNGTYSRTRSFDSNSYTNTGKWIMAGNLVNINESPDYPIFSATASKANNTVVLTRKYDVDEDVFSGAKSPLTLTVKSGSGEPPPGDDDYALSGVYRYVVNGDNNCSLNFKSGGAFDFTNTKTPASDKSGTWSVSGNEITLGFSSPVTVSETFTITDTNTTVTFTLKDDKAMSNILQLLLLPNQKVLELQKPAS